MSLFALLRHIHNCPTDDTGLLFENQLSAVEKSVAINKKILLVYFAEDKERLDANIFTYC